MHVVRLMVVMVLMVVVVWCWCGNGGVSTSRINKVKTTKVMNKRVLMSM